MSIIPENHPKLNKLLRRWRSQDSTDSESIRDAYEVGRVDGIEQEKERLAILGAKAEVTP